MLTSNEIRESFKEFFKNKGHQIVPSAPMVIKDDPTLMFTNAGMNQFKDIILGNRVAQYTRVADLKSVFASVVSTMTWRKWATTHTTTQCLKCLVTGRLAIISKKKLSTGRGNTL